MKFTANEYYQASLERIKQARAIYHQEASYALAMYCSGLAVESLLRAFRWTKDESFDGRHDLSELLKASRLLAIDEEYMQRSGESPEAIRAAVNELQATIYEVIILWHNNLRFASEASLKTSLRNIGRMRKIKGDPLKKNALDLLNAAQFVIDRGVTLWTSKKRS